MAGMNTKATSLSALLAFGLFSFACGGDTPATTGAPAASAPAGSAQVAAAAATSANPVLAAAVPTPEIEAQTKAIAALGPHQQAAYPPIPFRGYAPPRPPDVVTAAFKFAAEHPEVASYVPCFCGCQQGGHKGNHDCFVRSRAANGDVIEWEEHGVECAVCIDVATRSRQLLASGASVQEIRTAIEREFVPSAQTMTPTPKPPAAHSH
jgi:hypothetical protein